MLGSFFKLSLLKFSLGRYLLLCVLLRAFEPVAALVKVYSG